jgi:hypothetical protein
MPKPAKTYDAANLRKTHGSGYRTDAEGKRVRVIHYTTALATAGYCDGIRPICGQRSRQARYGIVTGEAPVNCEKCLAATAS